MTAKIKILAVAGSTRTESINKKLTKCAINKLQQQNIEKTYIDLRDYPLPVYDGDYEANNPYPESAKKLKPLFAEANGLFIASPEYNGSITAVLKNTIDWLTRSDDANTDLDAFSSKVVAISSSSPGNLGGLRGLNHLRTILSNIGCFVIPNQAAISQGFSAFDENNNLTDERNDTMFTGVINALVETTKRFNVDLESYCNKLFGEYCADQMREQ